MASSRVEIGSCVLNRPSKLINTTRYEKTNNGYLHSCIASTRSVNTYAGFESEILKTQNNVDLSWLPNYDDANKASESHHHNGEIDFDYSWLPDHFDTRSTAAAKSSNSNCSTETENDSWLPSTAVVNGEVDDSWLPNYNDVKRKTSTVPLKPNNFICSTKTENDSIYSTFSSTHTVTNGNHSKETIAHEIVFSGDQIRHELNKKPESSKSQGRVSPVKSDRCSVETDSLGGVSTLRRRFLDLVESRNTRRKARSSSGSNNSKSPVVITESDNNNLPESPSFFDVSDGVASPSTPAASPAAGNANELFAQICNTWDHKQVAGGKSRCLRGREAFKDFLSLIEQDKQRELESLARRKPVSDFPYRGRIRALLRVKIMKLAATNNQKLKFTTTSYHSAKGTKHRHQITELTTPVNEVFYETHDTDRADYDEKGLDDDIQLENFHDCSSEYSRSESDWDEEKEDWDMQPSYEWVSGISRPISYWECLRQVRYKEMLHLYSHTHTQDIRELLERRMVTSCLSSDFRDTIEHLMVGRAQGRELRKDDREEEEDEDVESKMERECREYNEFIDQRSSFIVSCC